MKTVCKCFLSMSCAIWWILWCLYNSLSVCMCLFSISKNRSPENMNVFVFLFIFSIQSFFLLHRRVLCVCVSARIVEINSRIELQSWCVKFIFNLKIGVFYWFKILLGQKVSNTVIAKSFTHDLLDAFMIHSFEGCLTNRYGWENTWRTYGTPAIWKGEMNDCAYT